MPQPAEYTEYFPTGMQDEILKNEVQKIVSHYNKKHKDNLIYAPKDEYHWTIRHEPKIAKFDFHMYVVYDDEAMVVTYTPEQKALVEEILDAIDGYLERLEYPGTARFGDDDYSDKDYEYDDED